MPEDKSSAWIVAVVQGNREELEEWQPVPMANVIVRTVEGLTRAGIQLDARMLDELLGEVESRGHTCFLIEIFLLQALFHQRRCDLPRAIATLPHALELAEPEGYVRLFLAEGEPLLELLTAALHACGAAREASAMAGERSPQARAQPLSAGKGGPFPEEISESERLMLAGLSNQEIAQQLILAENTIKWSIKSIHNNLAVHNRVQAMLRARELRL